jgi:hypothetical protein
MRQMADRLTLQRSIAEQSDYDIVWLKNLASEFYADGLGTV